MKSILALLSCLCVAGLAQAVDCRNNIPANNPDKAYRDNGDGTVTDLRNGLMWKKCIDGLSGANCDAGTPNTFTWAQALHHGETHQFAGYNDWRVPNVRELLSLVERCRIEPAINNTLFPNTPGTPVEAIELIVIWTSSPFFSSSSNSDTTWGVDFENGTNGMVDRTLSNGVRLVRGGEGE